MRYGDLVVTTALYRSQCECDLAVELARGEECPSCPRCDSAVDWAYERSTFRPPPAPSPDGGSSSGRQPIRVSGP